MPKTFTNGILTGILLTHVFHYLLTRHYKRKTQRLEEERARIQRRFANVGAVPPGGAAPPGTVAIAFIAAEEAAERANDHEQICFENIAPVSDQINLLITGADGIQIAYHYSRPPCIAKELRGDPRVVRVDLGLDMSVHHTPDDISGLDDG